MTNNIKFIQIEALIDGMTINMTINPNHIAYIAFGRITLTTPFANGSYSVGIPHYEDIEAKLRKVGLLDD